MNSSFASPSDAKISAATAAYRSYMDEATATHRRYMDESTAAYHKYVAESMAAYQKYVTQPTATLSTTQRATAAAAESAAAYQKYVTQPTVVVNSSAQGFSSGVHTPPVVSKLRSWSPAVITESQVARVPTSSPGPTPLVDPAYGPSDPQYGAAVSETEVEQEPGPRHANRSKTTGRALRDLLYRLFSGN